MLPSTLHQAQCTRCSPSPLSWRTRAQWTIALKCCLVDWHIFRLFLTLAGVIMCTGRTRSATILRHGATVMNCLRLSQTVPLTILQPGPPIPAAHKSHHVRGRATVSHNTSPWRHGDGQSHSVTDWGVVTAVALAIKKDYVNFLLLEIPARKIVSITRIKMPNWKLNTLMHKVFFLYKLDEIHLLVDERQTDIFCLRET